MLIKNFAFFPIELHPEAGRQSLYMDGPFPTPVEDGLFIGKGETLTVDGVMNSLYDREVHPFLGGKRLALRVMIQGACRVILMHRAANGAEIDYGSAISPKALRTQRREDAEGMVQTFELEFGLMSSEQAFGRWFFRIEPLQSDVKLLRATWLVREADVGEIRPAFVICTFKREEQVTANVRRLMKVLAPAPAPAPAPARQSATPLMSLFGFRKDRAERQPRKKTARVNAGADGYGILVVDNAGTLPQEAFPSPHVRLITQRNVGGAGGFGRGIFEAIEAGTFTHIIMLDDDADIDDISIVKMLNLLRLSKDPDLFVGGLQFDTYSPCQLADAGTYWTPERFERPIGRMAPTDMGTAEGKDGLARGYNSNFNGWWLFGGPIEAFQAYGMPLPCFVHLDDVEFGVRVQLNGGRTVTVPGIAVWHEPYYAKVEGWFAYYNIRNELIRLSVQTPIVLSQLTDRSATVIARRSQDRVASVSKQLRNRFRDFVNAYQYGSAMLLAKAIEDFSDGASILRDKDAEALHVEVMTAYKETNVNYSNPKTLPAGFISERPSQGSKLYRLSQIYSRNGNRVRLPARNDASRITMFASRRDINWKWIRARQTWGYPDPGSASYHIYKFDSKLYTKVEMRFRQAIKRFEGNARRAQTDWSAAYSELTSHDFWSKLIKTF